MHILIAPNAFKNSLDAASAAQAIYTGLIKSRLDFTADVCPVADGGDGTGELITAFFGGETITCDTLDPLGRPIKSSYGLIREGSVAVIEMAAASGLRLLDQNELDPLRASSFGTGVLIRHALDQKVKVMLLAMGGSATVDGGTGILTALGARFLDAAGMELARSRLPEDLTELHSVDVSHLDTRIFQTRLVILCDVNSPLLGPEGAAKIYGPQKGANSSAVATLEKALARFNDVTFQQTQKDMAQMIYSGTAGGAAAGLAAFLNAGLVSGGGYFMDLTGFEAALAEADLVITGEGKIDDQTLMGKGAFQVARKAKALNLPVIALAGSVPLVLNGTLAEYFDALIAIGNEPAGLNEALRDTTQNITRVSRAIGELLQTGARIGKVSLAK